MHNTGVIRPLAAAPARKSVIYVLIAAIATLLTVALPAVADEQHYSITLYSDEGHGKTNGHVFIGLSDGTQTLYRGWYSENRAYTAVFGTDGGVIKDDSEHALKAWDVKKTYPITEAGYKRVVDAVQNWEKSGRPWSVRHHCGDFAEAMAQEAGLDVHLPVRFTGRTRPGLFGEWLDKHGGVRRDSEAGKKDIEGMWESDWGPVTLSGTTSITGSWKQGAGKVGIIKSGEYDAATGKLTFRYYQHWNNQNGTAELTLSDDGKALSGTWTQSGASGGWKMTRG